MKHIADKVAWDVYTRPIEARTADVVRDACDVATGSSLSCSTLDRLCDMVEKRLRSYLWMMRIKARHPPHGRATGRGGGTSFDFRGGENCDCDVSLTG